MNPVAQLIISAVALATLLAGAASHATNIAELPLKASVLAKPNMIVGLDDSGSMDAELLLPGTEQGMAHFMRTSTVLYPGGALRSTGDLYFTYLFPNGTGAGNRVTGDSGSIFRALPPTPQLAWARSKDYNPIYYDSLKTYEPWAPTYISGAAATTFANATPAAARSHPLNGSSTMKLDGVLTSTTSNWLFTFTAGMIIPAGATTISCESGSAGTLPYTVTTGNKACKASVGYYPATFWIKDTSCTIDSTTCVYSYDGTTKLKRYEIKSGVTFPSGRTFAAELQNFANWFTYFRKRRLLLGSAMGDVLEYMTGLNLGVVNFNSRSAPTMYDLDATALASGRLAATRPFYVAENFAATPTNATMAYIADQFDTNTAVIKYACQRNAMFLMTDGFANDALSAPPAYSSATWGSGPPYTTITAKSLHDKALAYFTRRLRETTSPLAAGKVPISSSTAPNADKNPDLHINTYAMTLGVPGTIWPSVTDPYVTAPAWPTPVADQPSMIDDLWHATINGRGQMYYASDVAGTVAAIQAGLLDFISQISAQSGVAVSTVNLIRGDSRAYFGIYDPSGWRGDVKARSINSATGVIASGELWSASTLLTARDWTTRVIASYDGSAGVGFTAAAVGGTVNPGGIYGTTSDVINYLRGDRSKEGTTFRTRTGLMGAILNSEPAISKEDNVLYVASGEGMLHAFDLQDPNAGRELWAFVPRVALSDIGATVARGYSFKTQLDGSPVVGKVGTTKLLVAGTGAAARGFFALDVTSPRGLSESGLAAKVKWEFPAAGDATTQAKVGQALGRAVIARTTGSGYVVLVTSGYNNTHDGKGRMWMLNANTGAIIHEFTVPDGTLANESGLAHVAALEEGDGTARYVYGGDLLGNLWKFDLQTMGAPEKLAVLTGPAGDAQPVTAAPELTMIEGNRVVIVATGRLLDTGDFGNSKVQSVYAIKDGSTLNPARSSLVAQPYSRSGASESSGTNTVDWSTQRGWYADLPAGEQANTRPAITYSGVAVVTNKNGGTDCSASSYLYLFDVTSGRKYPGADTVATVISSVANATEVTTVITTDGKARGLVQDYDDKTPTPRAWAPPAIPPGKNAWREIRRE